MLYRSDIYVFYILKYFSLQLSSVTYFYNKIEISIHDIYCNNYQCQLGNCINNVTKEYTKRTKKQSRKQKQQ